MGYRIIADLKLEALLLKLSGPNFWGEGVDSNPFPLTRFLY